MRFKIITFGAFALLLVSRVSFCTNSLPKILISEYNIDEEKKELAIVYSVFDPDEKDVQVWPELYDSFGTRIKIRDSDIHGDSGYPVTSDGTSKTIVVDYKSLGLSGLKVYVRLVADDHYKSEIADIVRQVNQDSLRAFLTEIYGPRNSETKNSKKYEATRSFILNRFRSYNLTVHSQDTTIEEYDLQKIVTTDLGWNPPPVPKRNLLLNIKNLIAEKPTDSVTNEVLILGAHYDTKTNSPGADDNGSGVAGVLEAARILSKYSFRKKIRFICFDLEEAGFYGSWFYVERELKPGDRLISYLNFDMISRYSEKPYSQHVPKSIKQLFPDAYNTLLANKMRGNFMLVTANENSSTLSEQLKRLTELYVPELNTITLVTKGEHALTESLTSSDHAPFWYKNQKAIYIGEGGATRNKYKDTKRDVISDVNYQFMTNVVKATIAMIVETADIQHTSVAIQEVKFN